MIIIGRIIDQCFFCPSTYRVLQPYTNEMAMDYYVSKVGSVPESNPILMDATEE